MVLEHLFPENWLEKRVRYAFILAVVYSTVSVLMARMLFARNSGIVSVVFTALFLLPYIKKLLMREEKLEGKERKFTLGRFWFDNKSGVKVYFALFFGIYFTYMVYAFILSLFPAAGSAPLIFAEQLAPELGRGAAIAGEASGMGEALLHIATNNWWVLLACFLLALIAGDAAIFFIAWNASSWGSIFGFRAVEAAVAGAFGPFQNLIIIAAITLPHVLLEGGAYILAAIAGGVISDDISERRVVVTRFLYYFIGAAVVFTVVHRLLGRLLLVSVYPGNALLLSLLDMLVILLALHYLMGVFTDGPSREVFRYNYALFVVAVLLFIVGVLVEVYVLTHSDLLNQVYYAASLRL